MTKLQTLSWALLTALGSAVGVLAGIALSHALK
jgi:hypothetical protein